MGMAYEVKLDAFEGPLDLLLHLVNQLEIDLYDIPVAQITKQYMNYLHQMKYLELNIASEYLVMAATLLAIKSRMLLPIEDPIYETDKYEVDPREELAKKLQEYKSFKEAASKLQASEGKNTYTRLPKLESLQEKVVEPDTMNVYDMLLAMKKMLERKKWKEPLTSTIVKIEIPIEQKMRDIIKKLDQYPNGILFEDLFEYPDKSHIVATFMAILELLKDSMITCKQDKHFHEIILNLVK